MLKYLSHGQTQNLKLVPVYQLNEDIWIGSLLPISGFTKQSNKNLERLYNCIVVWLVVRLVVCNAGPRPNQTKPDQTRPDQTSKKSEK